MINVDNERSRVRAMRDIESELILELSKIKSIHKDLSMTTEGELITQLIDTLSECETKLSNGLDNLENDLNDINNLIDVIHQRELDELIIQKGKESESDVKVISYTSD